MKIWKGLRAGVIALAATITVLGSMAAAEPKTAVITQAAIRPAGSSPVSFVSYDRMPVTQLNRWVNGYLVPVSESKPVFALSSDQLQEAVALSNEMKDTTGNNPLLAFLARFDLVAGGPGNWTLAPAALRGGVVVESGETPGTRRELARRSVQRAAR